MYTAAIVKYQMRRPSQILIILQKLNSPKFSIVALTKVKPLYIIKPLKSRYCYRLRGSQRLTKQPGSF